MIFYKESKSDFIFRGGVGGLSGYVNIFDKESECKKNKPFNFCLGRRGERSGAAGEGDK